MPPPLFLVFTGINFTGTSIRDLNDLQKGIDESDAESSNLDSASSALREYRLAHGKAPESGCSGYSEEWLDQFNTFSIYEILPQIIELWGLNVEQQVASKKTSQHRAGNDNPALFTPVRADRAIYLGA